MPSQAAQKFVLDQGQDVGVLQRDESDEFSENSSVLEGL
ncbi:hypothetical protein PJE062_4875 [Pseudovibrio sp. JE062]|nr:hypothetical protein PJE062_4875 [Pseudovibrio sp. JE062]